MKKGKTLVAVFAAEAKKRAFIEMSDLAKLPRMGSPKTMNKTERDFAWILEAQKREGKILRYEYEGMALKWAGMRYTPDFVVIKPDVAGLNRKFTLIEVKGAHIWSRDIVRFKGCRDYWPEFKFEMWQKTKGGWKQKY
jgi:hypothetical protein